MKRKKRCIANRTDGEQCKRTALEGSDRCPLHPEGGQRKRPRGKHASDRSPVNLSLSAASRMQLTKLSADRGISRSELIEELLWNAK